MVTFLKKKMPMIDQEYIRAIGFTGEPGNLDERLMEMVDAYFPHGANKQMKGTAAVPESPMAGEDQSDERQVPKWGSDVLLPDGELAAIS